MKTFKYYLAPCLNDSRCYSVRGKLKKDVEKKLMKAGYYKMKNQFSIRGEKVYYGVIDEQGYGDMCSSVFGKIEKAEIAYTSLMDLVDNCLGENHGGEL